MTADTPDSRQLVLPLDLPPAVGRDEFVAAPANRAALKLVESWATTPAPLAVIVGPDGSGKSHLAAIWSEQTGRPVVPAAQLGALDPISLVAEGDIALEDVDGPVLDQTALFHLLNAARGAGARILMTARTAPEHWPIVTADLRSRLRTAIPVEIGPPDEALLAAILMKQFVDRGLDVEVGVLDFLLARMERSYAAASRLAAAVDRRALALGRRPTRRIAAAALAELGMDPDSGDEAEP